MKRLDASAHEDIVRDSYELAQQARLVFEEYQAGRIYIPRSALKAMGRRYLHLRDADDLSMLEVYEFGRLYAFFSLLYPVHGELPSPADTAVDLCNLLSLDLPISKSLHGGGGG